MDELKGHGAKTWRSAMILPKHQDAIDAWYASQQDVVKPILSRDRIDEINQTIQRSCGDRCLVQISYYNNRRIENINGIIGAIDPIRKNIVILQNSTHKVSISLLTITDIIEV